MRGGYPRGARPLGAFRLISSAAARIITGTAVLAGGGAALAPALRLQAASAAIIGGGATLAPALRLQAASAAIIGGGATLAPALRLQPGSAAIGGGGTVTVPAPSASTDFPVNARRILATDAASRVLLDQQSTPAARIIAIGPATRTVQA
jgi:hypothetical protein